MNKKRYVIVRVDNCPSKYEKGFNDYFVCDGRGKDTRLGVDKINCKKCNYGDTKEQLIRKVAQVLFRRRLDLYKLIWGGVPSKTEAERYYEVRLEIAKEIVEFLGVK